MSLFDLSDKVAVVTGGNGGIGYAIAESLGLHGAKVVIAGRNQEKNSKCEVFLKEKNTQPTPPEDQSSSWFDPIESKRKG